MCSLLIGVARRLGGDAEGARASLAAAERAAGVRAGPPWLLLRSLAELAALAADGGDWEAADGLVGRARAVGDARALQRDTGMIDVCAVAALVLARLGQPADVAREGRRCRHLLATTVHVPPWLGIDVRIRLARASLMIAKGR